MCISVLEYIYIYIYVIMSVYVIMLVYVIMSLCAFAGIGTALGPVLMKMHFLGVVVCGEGEEEGGATWCIVLGVCVVWCMYVVPCWCVLVCVRES